MPLADLIASLRKAAATWFRNDDLLLLEELIRRVNVLQKERWQPKDDGHDRTGYPHTELTRHNCLHPDHKKERISE